MYKGKDSPSFWFGVVEDRMDPLEIGRCRVRVLGYHPEFRKDFPTEKLPWASSIIPPDSASMSGKGVTPVGLVEGSWVVGFFLDGAAAQLPIIIGSIYGLNETLAQGENFGDGFRDVREAADLTVFPVDDFNKQEYPDGKAKHGDAHGAQLENTKTSKKYPRKEYAPESSKRKRGTPDLNILAIADKERLKETIVDLKRKGLNSSGLRDIGIDVADCIVPLFICGVTNQSTVNRGTNKMLGVGLNIQPSTSMPSRKTKNKQFVDKPTNNNAIRIDSAKTMG